MTRDFNYPTCLAHSGVMARITIGGTIIAVLMATFIGLMRWMWVELRNQNADVLRKVESLASVSEVKEIKVTVDYIGKKQVEIDGRVISLEKRIKE